MDRTTDLAKNAECKAVELSARCMLHQQAGFSMIEMVLSLVIVGIIFTGTLQIFGTLLNGSVYPFIEKQAIAMADTIIGDPDFRTGCDHPKEVCTREMTFNVTDRYSFYRDATHHQFQAKISVRPVEFQQNIFILWDLELIHHPSDHFKFTQVRRP